MGGAAAQPGTGAVGSAYLPGTREWGRAGAKDTELCPGNAQGKAPPARSGGADGKCRPGMRRGPKPTAATQHHPFPSQ